MLYYETKTSKGSEIYIWKMDEPTEAVAEVAQCKNDDTYATLGKKRQREWAFVRMLLCKTIPESKIRYNEKGKPYLEGKEWSISISHTGDYAAIMLNKEKRDIGFDIETRKKDTVLRVKERFMSKYEMGLEPTCSEKIDALINWTSKESLYKILNTDAVDYIDHYEIRNIEKSEEEGKGTIVDKQTNKTYELRFKIFDEFVLSMIED